MKTRSSVLIIGASGFIGRHTVEWLSRKGWNVFAQHLPGETPASLPGVVWFPCNLNDPAAVQSWPKKCDKLIFLAQSPAYRDFPEGARDVFDVNVAAALRAVEYARTAGTDHFIFASSGNIYGQTIQPARESDPLDMAAGRSFYTASKLAAELLIQPYAALMSVISLRFFMPYGAGQNPGMLIPETVRRVREQQAIDLQGMNGMEINPIYIAELTETLERCLTLMKSTTLNVAGPERLSLREIGEQIGRVIGLPPVFVTHPDQTAPVIVGDTTLLSEQLGWAPGTPFQSGLTQWLKGISKTEEGGDTE